MRIPAFLQPLPDAALRLEGATRDVLYRTARGRVLAALTLIYAFFYTTRGVLDVVKKPLLDAGIYDADQLGTLGTCLLGAYAVGKLLNGVVADRVRVSRFLAVGLGASAVMNILMGLNTVFFFGCALWLINGYSQGVGAVASVRSLTQWFSGTERGRAYGTWSAAHSLGEGATLIATASIVVHLGWRAGFLAPGIACLLVALAALFVLRDRPQAYGLPEVHDWKGEIHEETATSTREAQLRVVRSPAIWICALSSALLFVTRYGVKSWGVLYLQEERGYSLPSATAFIAMNTLSGLFGSVAYGFVSDLGFKGRRPPATLWFGVVEVLALLVMFYGPRNGYVLTAALIVYGFALSGILAVLGGLLAVDVSSKRAAGMAMGFIGFISYLGAAAQEKLSGLFLKAHTVVMADGTKHISDWSAPIALWIGGSVASALLAATLWRVQPRE
ncbi:MAG TPA: MFS transporter [Candidatus Eisenbacteria bacterium]|jgi:OPA family sugar phosphate sensor protein UhpC-like MFS transporter